MNKRLDNFSDKEIKLAFKIEVEKNPFVLIEKELLSIRDKAGNITPLILNPCQKKVLKKIKDTYLSKKPVRVWILKARQQGISTLVQAIIFSFCSQKKNKTALVIGYDTGNSNHLFEIGKRYHEQLKKSVYFFLVGDKEKSNQKKIKFADTQSEILSDTSNKMNAGRSFTFQFMHCSEVAGWRDAKENYTALNQALPLQPYTIQFNETTAKGVGNFFHKKWKSMEDAKDNPNSIDIPIFIAWFENPEYSLPLKRGEELELTPKEIKLKKDYQLSLAQLKWRRICIKNNCNGDNTQFEQEYPSNAHEAFLASGQPVFDLEILYRRQDEAEKAQHLYKKYNIVDYQDFFKFELGTNGGKYGDFDIYQKPEVNFEYLATADIAEGKEGGDYSVLNLINVRTGEHALHYKSEEDIDIFTKKCVRACRLYNNALLAPERNNHGHAFITIAKNQYKYGNLYLFQEVGKPKENWRVGFPTTIATRTQAITTLQRLIREEFFTIHCPRTISELTTFVKHKGKMQAQVNCHDDEVATFWIMAYIMNEGLLQKVLSSCENQGIKKNTYLDGLYFDRLNQRNFSKNKSRNKTTGY